MLIQPARGYNLDPKATYHDPALVPPHSYFAAYAWLADSFRADAVIDLGKHGTLEWLPGKALALSGECYPEAVLGPLPHLYPFIVNDPGEGSQAKRRAQAVIIDHLTPPLTRAGSYGPQAELERLIDEYYEASRGDVRRVAPLAAAILERARAAGIDRDCGIAPDEDLPAALRKLDGFLCELKELQIRDGLHVLGESPDGERLDALLLAIARARRGAGAADESLMRALAADLGLGANPLMLDLAEPWTGPRPDALCEPSSPPLPSPACGGGGHCGAATEEPSPASGGGQGGGWRTAGDTVERLEALALRLIAGEQPAAEWHETRAVFGWIERVLRPAVTACGAAEISGAAGRARRSPGRAGAERGAEPRPPRCIADRPQFLFGRHARGAHPGGLAIWLAFGRAAGRALRPGSRQLPGPPGAVGLGHRQHAYWRRRHRSGAGADRRPAGVGTGERPGHRFRDPAGLHSRPAAGRCDVAHLRLLSRRVPRPDRPVRQRGARRRRARRAACDQPAGRPRRRRPAGARRTGDRAGRRFAARRLSDLRLAARRLWRRLADADRRRHLARRRRSRRRFSGWSQWAYGAGGEGRPERGLLEARLATADAVLHNQDNREHDLLDSDDYYQFEGGLALAVRHLSGRMPAVYHNDHSQPDRPRVRTLREEIGRIVRGRAGNLRWIAGVMRHGYKGAAEIAATVDYLFAFAATARAVDDAHFDALYDAYLGDAAVRQFMARHNPAALAETESRFREAIERGLWRPTRNSLRAELLRDG